MNETTRAVLYAAVKERVREALKRRVLKVKPVQQEAIQESAGPAERALARYGRHHPFNVKGNLMDGFSVDKIVNLAKVAYRGNHWFGQDFLDAVRAAAEELYPKYKDYKRMTRDEFIALQKAKRGEGDAKKWFRQQIFAESAQEARVSYEVEKAVRWMSRKDMQDLLENYGFAVYERESDKELEDAIIANIEDGVIDPSEVL